MRKDIRKLIEKEKNPIWRRVFAYLTDILIIQAIVYIIFYSRIKNLIPRDLSFIDAYKTINSNPDIASLFLFMSIITSILAIIYFTLFELKFNQSIGKMLFKIKIYSDLKKIKFWQVFVRNISKALFFVSPLNIIFIIDLISLVFSGKRLFEKFSKTYVKKVEK